MHIVEWCNTNLGFLTAVLSILTLITSISAIIVSFIVANLPYKKKLDIWEYADEDNDNFIIYINITNIGNKSVRLKGIEILCNSQQLCSEYFTAREQPVLRPTESKEIKTGYPLNVYNERNVDPVNSRMKIIVIDMEGTRYSAISDFGVG